MVLDDDNPWDGILASIMFSLRDIVHTTTQYMPAQLVFGHDSILNQHHKDDWEGVEKRKRPNQQRQCKRKQNLKPTHSK